MNILEKGFLWILYSSLTSTVIVLVVLLIKKVFKNQLKPRLHHALWFLVLIRLLMPFVPESNLSLFNLFIGKNIDTIIYNSFHSEDIIQEQIIENRSELNLHLKDSKQDNISTNIYLKENLSKPSKQILFWGKETSLFQKIESICSYIWLIGVLSICALILISILEFKKKSSLFNEVNDLEVTKILDICKEKLNVNKNIQVYSGNIYKSPFIYGFLNPTIYLPKHILNEVNNNQLLHICLHEVAHYKRKDLFYNLLGIVATIIHWFNPIVWFAMKKMKADRELACDNYVLETLGENESIPYGMTIIKLSQVISNQRYKNVLSAHFYENKTQIERRITMIKMFKKGSYKISIVAVGLLVILGATALTNATSLKGEINKKEISAQDITENGEFEIGGPSKFFNNLDRAKDFIDFEFKVPDFIPSGYEFSEVNLKGNNIMSVDFEKNGGSLVYFKISKEEEDIMKEIKESYIDSRDAVEFREEPMSVDNTNGNSLTIDRKYEDSNKERLRNVATIEKHFIWKDDNIWYSLLYYHGRTLSDSSSYNDEISKDDIQKIISSIKYPNDIKSVSYKSKPFEYLLFIYGNKDLNTAEKMLGFKPKFPLSLPIGFYPTSSKVSVTHYRGDIDSDTLSEHMKTSFYRKGKDTSRIEFDQIKNPFFYNNLEENGYVETEDYRTSPENKYELIKVKVNTLELNNIKVFTYEKEVRDYLSKSPVIETIKERNYVWKQGDIVYTATFNGNIDNEHEIVETLIKMD